MNFNIFPIPIKYYNFPDNYILKSEILQYNFDNTPHIYNEMGTVSYFQSHQDLSISFFKNCNISVIKKFKDFCLESAFDYASNVCEYDIDRMICTNSWINFYKENSGQSNHSHTNSVISSNYFVQFKENTDIKFWNPAFMDNPHKNILEIQKKQVLKNNFDWITLQGLEGHLIFFPSWLVHSVDSTNNKNRITISMNYVPKTIKNASYGFSINEE